MNPLRPEATARLVINRGDSRCENCSRDADPGESHHLTVTGLTRHRKGCGARYTSLGTDYFGVNIERQLVEKGIAWGSLTFHGLPVYNAFGQLVGHYEMSDYVEPGTPSPF